MLNPSSWKIVFVDFGQTDRILQKVLLDDQLVNWFLFAWAEVKLRLTSENKTKRNALNLL